jgi:hypothetical protein
VEADWGLCRLRYRGDLNRRNGTQEAITIAVEAGDEWIASLARWRWARSLVMAARYGAARHGSTTPPWVWECSDQLGGATRIWMAYAYFRQKKSRRIAQILPDAGDLL